MSTYTITPARYRLGLAIVALSFCAQAEGIVALFLQADAVHYDVFAIMAIVCPVFVVRYTSRRWLAPYRAARGQA